MHIIIVDGKLAKKHKKKILKYDKKNPMDRK